MIEILENIGIVLSLIVMTFFVYMSSHLVSEKKAGKTLPLFWEEDRTKPFDKSDIEYRDGDNT